MPRQPGGPSRSDTALLSYIAYKLEGVRVADLDDWAEQLGIAMDGEALRKAPERSTKLKGVPNRRGVLRPGLRIDWRALDFFVALVRLRIGGGEGVVGQLEEVSGVIDVFSLAQDGETLVTVVYERRSDRDALALRLAELGEVLAWEDVVDHRPVAVISTLRSLARQAAEREGWDI